MQQEAICEHCKITLTVTVSSTDQIVNCTHCNYNFRISKNNLIIHPEAFTKKKTDILEINPLKFPIKFIRHGKDNYQEGIVNKITTKFVKFTSKIKLLPTSKISFLIIDKKFIVSIRKCQLKINIDLQGNEDTRFDIVADFVTITQGVKKKLIRANPHYLIK